MLKIFVPESTDFNEETNEFIENGFTLELEHSLASLATWESKWEKPFLGDVEKTDEETRWYLIAMTQNEEPVPSWVYNKLTDLHMAQINAYLESNMTATWFATLPGNQKPGKKETVTAEVIYYWMIALNIPFECQHWHLQRLFTLIKVCNEKQQPEKKKKMTAAERRNLNALRKRQAGTSG